MSPPNQLTIRLILALPRTARVADPFRLEVHVFSSHPLPVTSHWSLTAWKPVAPGIAASGGDIPAKTDTIGTLLASAAATMQPFRASVVALDCAGHDLRDLLLRRAHLNVLNPLTLLLRGTTGSGDEASVHIPVSFKLTSGRVRRAWHATHHGGEPVDLSEHRSKVVRTIHRWRAAGKAVPGKE